MDTNDHSMYGYMCRMTDQDLLGLLARVKSEEESEFNRFMEETLTKILTSRGVDTNIDMSLAIAYKVPKL